MTPPAPLLARTAKDFIKVKGWGGGEVGRKRRGKNRTLQGKVTFSSLNSEKLAGEEEKGGHHNPFYSSFFNKAHEQPF